MNTYYSIFIFLIAINSAFFFSIEVKTNVIVNNDSNNKTNSEGNKIKIAIDVPDIVFNKTAIQNITTTDKDTKSPNVFKEVSYNRIDNTYTKDIDKDFKQFQIKGKKTNAYRNLNKHLLALMKSSKLPKKRSILYDADQMNNRHQLINKLEDNAPLSDNENYEKDIEEFIKHQYKTHIKSKKLNVKNKSGINKDKLNVTDQLINNFYQTVSSSESSSSELVGEPTISKYNKPIKHNKKIWETKSTELPNTPKSKKDRWTDKKKLLPSNKMLLNEKYQKIQKKYGIDSKNINEPYTSRIDLWNLNNTTKSVINEASDILVTERTDNISEQTYLQNNSGLLNLYYKIIKLLESPIKNQTIGNCNNKNAFAEGVNCISSNYLSPESKKLISRKLNFMGDSDTNTFYAVKSNKSESGEEYKLHSKYQVVSESNEEYPDDPLVSINNDISKKQKHLNETVYPKKTKVFYGSAYDINFESNSDEMLKSKETKKNPIHSYNNINQIKDSFDNEHRLNNSKETKDRIHKLVEKIYIKDTLENNEIPVKGPESNIKQQLPQYFEYIVDMVYNKSLSDSYSVENRNYTTNNVKNKKYGTNITAPYRVPNKQNEDKFEKDMKAIIDFLKIHQNDPEKFKKKKNTYSNLQEQFDNQKIIKLQNKKIPNTKNTYLIINTDEKTKKDNKSNGKYLTDQEPKCNITNQIVVSDNLMSSFIAHMNVMKNNENVKEKDKKTSEENIKFNHSYETMLPELFKKLDNIQETLKNNSIEKDKYHNEYLKALQQVTSGVESKSKIEPSVLNVIFVLNSNIPNDFDEHENEQESLEMSGEDATSNEIKRAVDNLINAVKSQHIGNLFNEKFVTSINKYPLFASILNKVIKIQDTGSPNQSELFNPKQQEHSSLPNETFPSIENYPLISETTNLAKLDKKNLNNVLPMDYEEKDMAGKNLTTKEHHIMQDPKSDESEDVLNSEHSFSFLESDSDENTSSLLLYEKETLHLPIKNIKSTIAPDLSTIFSGNEYIKLKNEENIDTYESESSQYSMDSNPLTELAHSDEYEIHNKPITDNSSQNISEHLDLNSDLYNGNIDDDSIQNTNENKFTTDTLLQPNFSKNKSDSFLSTTDNNLQGLTDSTTPKKGLFNSIENLSEDLKQNDVKLTLDEHTTQISKTLDRNQSVSDTLISDITKDKNISATNITDNNFNTGANNLEKLKLNKKFELSESDSDESNGNLLHDLDPDEYLTHISDTLESDSGSDNGKDSSVDNIQDEKEGLFWGNHTSTTLKENNFEESEVPPRNKDNISGKSETLVNENKDKLNLSKILPVQKNDAVNYSSSSNTVDDFFDDYQIEKDRWAVLHNDKVPKKKVPEENDGDYFSVINLDHNDMNNKKKKNVNARYKRSDGVINTTPKIGYKKAKWPHNKKYVEVSSGSKEGMNSLYVICEANEIRINGRCVKILQAKRHP